MDALHRLAPCDLGSIITAVPGHEWSLAAEIGDDGVLHRNFWRYLHELSPTEMQRLGGGFICADDVFDSRRRERLSVFREFLTPRRLNRVLPAHFVIDGRVWAIGLTRTGTAFSDRTRARLNAVLPHVRAALRARAWLGASDARTDQAVTSTYAGARAGGPWGLTPLQERTMDLVIRGLTNKEVAGLLGTSPHTVRNTLVNVFKKVGVTRRSELAFVVKNGITDGDPCRVRHAVSQHRTLIAAIAGQSPSPTRRAERRTTER